MIGLLNARTLDNGYGFPNLVIQKKNLCRSNQFFNFKKYFCNIPKTTMMVMLLNGCTLTEYYKKKNHYCT